MSQRSTKGSAHQRVTTIVAVAALTMGLTAASVASPASATSVQVTITRDSAGIPHITAPNFTALGYGEAWAFSQDNFCLLAQDFVTVNGDRSQYFGATGTTSLYAAGETSTNLNSDLFWKWIATSPLFASAVADASKAAPLGPLPQVKAIDAGFVTGYNAYLASGQLNDPTCKGQRWVRPITIRDLYLRTYELLMEASSEQFITYLDGATPPAGGSARQAAPMPSADKLRNALGMGASAVDTKRGSNALALGSQDTAAGDGMLLTNPHVPWEGGDRFWMAQLTVPGQYNVEGAEVSGGPLILFGFNQHVAWTHTSSSDFHFTLYRLALAAGHPTSYVVNGVTQKMTTNTVVVSTGGGHTASHTFYSSRWGPVLSAPSVGLGWSTTNAYAIADAQKDDLFRVADEYFLMGQATSVQGLLTVQSNYLGISYFNTIASDDAGHAYYADLENTPNVPLSLIQSTCVPVGLPQLIYSTTGIVTLDGSRSACAWKNDTGTPVQGIFGAAHMPHLIRTDYVENSNDTYWLANPNAPFGAFSPVIGKIRTILDVRTRVANLLVAERMAGTDGLGAPKFTISNLLATAMGSQSLLAQLVLPTLVSSCESTPSATATDGTVVDLTAACAALASYDGTANLSATGGWLFGEWAAYAPNETTSGPTGFWTDAFDPAHPLTTPSHFNSTNPKMLVALADAVEALTAHNVALNASYAQVQSVTRNSVVIPVSGCAAGCLNAMGAYDGTEAIYAGDYYGQAVYGNSMVTATELTHSGPVVEGILAYSEASNPASPWYSNMTTLYSQGHFVPLAYSPAQLAAESGNTTTTLTVP